MKPETYKAAVFRGPGHVDVVELPYPECGGAGAIVRNLLTGICGSDIFAYQKHGPTSRIWVDEEFGHEGIAEVVEIGKDVKGLSVGDRVFVNTDKAFRDKRRHRADDPRIRAFGHLLSGAARVLAAAGKPANPVCQNSEPRTGSGRRELEQIPISTHRNR